MSSTESVHRPALRARATRRKRVLFCPACDHESPLPGDWIVRESASNSRIRYDCPACDRAVLSQPTF